MADPFSNEPIRVDHLPQLHADAFVSVDPRYVWGRLAGLAGTTVVVIAVAVLVAVQGDNAVAPLAVGGGIVLLLVLVAMVSILESRRLAYQLREHDVSLRGGVIQHRVETIPFSRIQHVSVGRGLIERWLGLATLEVSSAGPDISVPGLSVADTDRIKQVVAERAGVADVPDEGQHGEPQASMPLPPPPWPAP